MLFKLFNFRSLSKYKITLIILGLILIVGFFLRGYKAVDRFEYSHDGDLYSWIVKDIVVDKHLRLIGQLTSTPGIFIGPLFYYSLIPFFLLTNMDPTGAIIFSLVLSAVTILSYYFIFKKLFNEFAGLFGAFLQAVLLSRVYYDRWVVPTITSSLWEIWFFYTLVMLAKGKFYVLPLLGILVGLIWHINFFLAPTLLAVPVAIYLSKKLPPAKYLTAFFISFFITNLPLLLFEVRHNFSQSRSFLDFFAYQAVSGSMAEKFVNVLSKIEGNIFNLFFYPSRGYNFNINTLLLLVFLISSFLIFSKLKDGKKIYTTLAFWFLGITIFFSLSNKIVSEYYLNSLNTLILGLFIIIFTQVFNKLTRYKYLIGLFISLILLASFFYVVDDKNYAFKAGYLERSQAIDFIKDHSSAYGYPCVYISYITSPGRNLGFRYLSYLSGLEVRKLNSGAPIYSIVLPHELAEKDINKRFGNIGVITPSYQLNSSDMDKICEGENTNLTGSMFGFVK